MEENVININPIIEENLRLSIESIFDERNENCILECEEFISTLLSISRTSSPLCDTIYHCLTETFDMCDEFIDNDEDIIKITNIKSNMGDNLISNQFVSDVEAFTTLYNKGYIKDDYMQKHITSQVHELKTTISDLMGRDWNGWANGSSNSIQYSVNDWINGDFLVNLNDMICNKEFDTSVSNPDIINSLLFKSKDFSRFIMDGTYEDMDTNASMCTKFAILAALITSRSLKDENLLRKIAITVDRLEAFGCEHGVNDFYTCSCMVINYIYYSLAQDMGYKYYINRAVSHAVKLKEWFDGHKVLLPKVNFPYVISSLLKSLESEYEFGLCAQDMRKLGIPLNPLMISDYSETDDERQSGMLFEESVKIGQSLSNCMRWDNIDIETNESPVLDSLVERFQVESDMKNDKLVDMSVLELHSAIMVNSNRLFHNASRHEYNALKLNLATNLIMMEKANSFMESNDGISRHEKIMIWKDLTQMEYQNNRYIGIVEACSNESVQQYAKSNKDKILTDMTKFVKRA